MGGEKEGRIQDDSQIIGLCNYFVPSLGLGKQVWGKDDKLSLDLLNLKCLRNIQVEISSTHADTSFATQKGDLGWIRNQGQCYHVQGPVQGRNTGSLFKGHVKRATGGPPAHL